MTDKQTAIEALLPCPFCGSKAKLTDHGEGAGGWSITCINQHTDGYKPAPCSVIVTGGTVPYHKFKDMSKHHIALRENAIKIWNSRASLQSNVAPVDVEKLIQEVINEICDPDEREFYLLLKIAAINETIDHLVKIGVIK